MINYALPLITGTSLGILHTTLLWLCMADNTFRLGSYLLLGDARAMAIIMVGIIDIVCLITILSSGYWLPKLMDYRDEVVERLEQEQEDEGDDE